MDMHFDTKSKFTPLRPLSALRHTQKVIKPLYTPGEPHIFSITDDPRELHIFSITGDRSVRAPPKRTSRTMQEQ